MKLIKYPDRSQWNEILKRPVLETENLFDTVRNIINRVRAGGDRVVMEYEAVFDKAELTSLAVTSAEIEEAEKEVPIELKAAIYLAKRNIETFHSAQRFEGKKVDTMEGVTCWQKAVAIEKVGLYIPGGTAPLSVSYTHLCIGFSTRVYRSITASAVRPLSTTSRWITRINRSSGSASTNIFRSIILRSFLSHKARIPSIMTTSRGSIWIVSGWRVQVK